MIGLHELVSQTPVFRKLSETEQEKLEGLATIRTLEKGEILALNGEEWPYVIIIANGLLHANKESAEGRCFTVRSFSDSDVFWGHALFGRQPTPTTLFAYKKTVIYQWHGQDIMNLILNSTEAMWDLCLQLNQRMLEASKTIEEIMFNPVINRLAKLLLEQFEIKEQPYIDRNMTLDEMASKIGSTREVVCRLLYRFSDNNLIQIDRNKFILINKIELNKIADGELLTKSGWQ